MKYIEYRARKDDIKEEEAIRIVEYEEVRFQFYLVSCDHQSWKLFPILSRLRKSEEGNKKVRISVIRK